MAKPTSNAQPSMAFRVGDRVGVRLGGQVLPAMIIEDRGDLGPRGTQLVRVALESLDDGELLEDRQFEVSVDALVRL